MKSYSNVYRYGLVIAACSIAVFVGWISGAEATCLLLGVMVSSLYGGHYPSLVGAGLSVLAFDFFFLTPRHHFSIASTAYPRFVAFIAAAFAIRYLIRSREEKIRGHAKELRELIDFIPHHVLVLDPGGRLLEANQMVLDYTGRTLDQMKNIETVERIRLDIHPDDIAKARGERQRNLSAGLPFEIERRALGKDGEYRWFLFRYKPLIGADGEISRWLCTATDIEELKREDERLRLVVDTTPAFIHSARPDGSVDYLNQRWLDYLGLSLESALDRELQGSTMHVDPRTWAWNLISTIHPEDLPLFTDKWNLIIGSCKPGEFEARVRRFDGLYRRFLFQVAPLCNKGGSVVKWYASSTDIEDRKRTEEELRQKEIEVANQLRLVIDTTPGLSWTSGPDGSADFFNRQWLEYSGLSIDEAIGWGFLVTIHPDDIPRMMEDVQRALKIGDFFESECRIRRYDGEYRRFLFRGSPVRGSEGSIVKWIGINTDVEDRRRMEDALRASEESLKRSEAYLLTAQRLSQTGSFGCKISTGEMIWSDETFRIFAYDRNIRPTIQHILHRVHPGDKARFQAYVDRAMRDIEDCDLEYRLLLPDESVKHLRLVAHTERDEAGTSKFLGAVTDITETRRAHEALRRSESYLLEGQRLTHTGSFGWSVPGKNPTYLSKECLRIFGFDPERGMPTWEDRLQRIHPADQAKWQEKIDRAIREKSGYEVTYRIILPCGILKHIHVVGHPMFSESGDLIEFIGTAMDITERWKVEEALRGSEHQLRLIIETIPAFVWCAMPGDGKVVYANQRFCNYTGRTLEELLEFKWVTLVHPDDVETTIGSWRHVLETGEPLEITHRMRRADGVYRWIQTLAEPLRDRENRITQWYGLNIEIDESRRMAEMLRATQARLTRATQIATVAELSASIAHEINQPLAAVVANGEACEMWLSIDPPNLERARLAVQRIVRDGNASAAVIQRIRALFKQEIANKAPLDMNEVIHEVLRLVSNEVQRKRVNVRMELSLEVPMTLADRVQMQQLMINLVNNGIEAMDGVAYGTKQLILRSRSDDLNSILIEVCDYGSGLVDVERVFEPFFTTKEKGMGMGLSICRSIIEAHGGSIWVTRNKDQGATFSFRLPVLAEKA
ncbi:PAS domain-containing protein [Granulicella sp. L60]|uniref:PAS domain-containing protein n=1 Tax=Granulicella sp. L60 TaxID=1641866 RepID=UPI00131B8E50|nr:PAS domain-containing protein [Granulicella sp. L60]